MSTQPISDEGPTNEAEASDSARPSGARYVVLPMLVILICHYLVDTYSATVPTLLGVVQTEFLLQPQWAAALLGFGSICSGLAQPVFAWLSDRLQTRLFSGLGIVLAACGICLIGFAPNPVGLFSMYAIGMLGVGMFHPISVSTMGRLAGNRRGLAISWFFVFGMGGFFTGSLLAPGLATGSGSLKHLTYMFFPGLVLAAVIHFSIRKIDHTQSKSKDRPNYSLRDYDWWSIGCLYFSAVFRFLVNTAMVYLLVRWMEFHIGASSPELNEAEIADLAAPHVGWANAIMILGQGMGGLVAGALIVSGREKLPMILTPIIFSPALWVLPLLPPGIAGHTACFFVGIGFAAMTPITISLAQSLMPGHTSLASGISLGGAWALAAVGPRLAELIIQRYSLNAAFLAIAISLVLAGLCSIGIRQQKPNRE